MTVKELKEALQELDPDDDDKFVCFFVTSYSSEEDNEGTSVYYRIENGVEIGHGTFEIFLEASQILGV